MKLRMKSVSYTYTFSFCTKLISIGLKKELPFGIRVSGLQSIPCDENKSRSLEFNFLASTTKKYYIQHMEYSKERHNLFSLII